uniref:Secreted protein n=1 Tax=Leersia perrieri TaxID=77586 RepID=A0A0D9VHS4_9ORYZ
MWRWWPVCIGVSLLVRRSYVAATGTGNQLGSWRMVELGVVRAHGDPDLWTTSPAPDRISQVQLPFLLLYFLWILCWNVVR